MTDRSTTLLQTDMPRRERQALSQSLDALTRANAKFAKSAVEVREREHMQKSMSMLDLMMQRLRNVLPGGHARRGSA